MRYLEAMGVARPLEKFTSLTAQQLGWGALAATADKAARIEQPGELRDARLAMSAFYGGRAEARIVRTPVPVAHVDFTSMYPAVNALLGTWRLLRAEHSRPMTRPTTYASYSPTRTARPVPHPRALASRSASRSSRSSPTATSCRSARTIDPDSDDFGIGVNPLRYHGTLWYALPDVIAAAILGADAPQGHARDPTRAARAPSRACSRCGCAADADRPDGDRDPFLVMIEERARVKATTHARREGARPGRAVPQDHRQRHRLRVTRTLRPSRPRRSRRRSPSTVPTEPRTEPTKTPEDPGPVLLPAGRALDHRRRAG